MIFILDVPHKVTEKSDLEMNSVVILKINLMCNLCLLYSLIEIENHENMDSLL